MLEEDVGGQLAHARPVLDARRTDLVGRKLKSSRAGVAQLDEVRVADAERGARPVRRPAAEYVCDNVHVVITSLISLHLTSSLLT